MNNIVHIIQEVVSIKYKCGHSVDKAIWYKNNKHKRAVIDSHGKRFVCEECRRKEIGC